MNIQPTSFTKNHLINNNGINAAHILSSDDSLVWKNREEISRRPSYKKIFNDIRSSNDSLATSNEHQQQQHQHQQHPQHNQHQQLHNHHLNHINSLSLNHQQSSHHNQHHNQPLLPQHLHQQSHNRIHYSSQANLLAPPDQHHLQQQLDPPAGLRLTPAGATINHPVSAPNLASSSDSTSSLDHHSTTSTIPSVAVAAAATASNSNHNNNSNKSHQQQNNNTSGGSGGSNVLSASPAAPQTLDLLNTTPNEVAVAVAAAAAAAAAVANQSSSSSSGASGLTAQSPLSSVMDLHRATPASTHSGNPTPTTTPTGMGTTHLPGMMQTNSASNQTQAHQQTMHLTGANGNQRQQHLQQQQHQVTQQHYQQQHGHHHHQQQHQQQQHLQQHHQQQQQQHQNQQQQQQHHHQNQQLHHQIDHSQQQQQLLQEQYEQQLQQAALSAAAAAAVSSGSNSINLNPMQPLHMTDSASQSPTVMVGGVVSEEACKKRELRLQKNREAAKECRRKKKEYIKCLENRVAVLEAQNKALIDELKTLRELYCKTDEIAKQQTTTSMPTSKSDQQQAGMYSVGQHVDNT